MIKLLVLLLTAVTLQAQVPAGHKVVTIPTNQTLNSMLIPDIVQAGGITGLTVNGTAATVSGGVGTVNDLGAASFTNSADLTLTSLGITYRANLAIATNHAASFLTSAGTNGVAINKAGLYSVSLIINFSGIGTTSIDSAFGREFFYGVMPNSAGYCVQTTSFLLPIYTVPATNSLYFIIDGGTTGGKVLAAKTRLDIAYLGSLQ